MMLTDDASSVLSALSEQQQRQLTELLDEYLRGLERGEKIDTEQWKREYPDLADALSAYFCKLDALHEIAVGFQADRTDEIASGSFELGDFTILREIGRGGMGVVYEARQRSLDRRVAIKLLPMAASLDSRHIARFKNESQAAGQLRHDNIVPVHSFGVDRGIHFYVMQLIDGTPIDKWVIQQRESTTAGRVDWRTVVGYAVDTAYALHCAHETGIVHRDIKPSNLLLENGEKIWITDFGLARCQNHGSLTLSGDLVGTMRYMSPEQARGQSELVDHRSDIYSLASTLFEILTLQPAIAGDDGPALLRAIDESDPPKLQKYRSDLSADLSVVLQKAMAGDKDRRYRNAKEFADDLTAVLEGRPTLAKPPTVVELAGRWAVRHRKFALAGSAALMVAFTCLLYSTMLILSKDHDRLSSEITAQRYFHQARSAVDHLGSRVAEQLAAVPGAEHVRQSLLLDTLHYYEDFVAQAASDPSLQAELALTHNRIGTITKDLSSPGKAITHFRRSAEIYQRLAEDQGLTAEMRQQMAANWNHLGLAQAEMKRFDAAEAAYAHAITLQQEIVAAASDSLQCEIDLAMSINNLGLLMAASDRYEEAESHLQDAINRLTRINSNHPQRPLVVRGLAAALGNLSSLTMDAKPESSIALLEKSIEYQLASNGRSTNRLLASSEIAKTYNNLGAAYSRVGNVTSAQQAFANAIQLQRQLLAIAPMVDAHRRDLALSLNNLAMHYQKQQDHAKVLTALSESIRLQEHCLKSDSRDPGAQSRMGVMKHNLAASLTALNRESEAQASLWQAIEAQRTALSTAVGDAEIKSHLLKHYAQLLRSQIRGKQWRAAEATTIAYREAARGDPQTLLAVAADLAEATKLTPSERQGRSISAVAATLGLARAEGLALTPALLQEEPFHDFANEPGLRKAVQP